MSTWWKTGIIYQVYPRSFMDSNADGVGDLQGVIQRLDYLTWLGVDAIWLSPIFRSPQADFGYDVMDYQDIDPLFGTLEDFDALIAEASIRQIKVILDLVPSHTSNQHAWFIESRSSRDNPKRDWYIWADAKPDGSPPNNWLAYFGGPAWTWDAATGQYYMHNFLPEQPELNYRNPMVVEAMKGIIRFWLARGVAGMRIDVIDRMLKDPEMRDNPLNPHWKAGDNPAHQFSRVHSEKHIDVHGLIRDFRRTFNEFGDRPMIGEIDYTTDSQYITSYYGSGLDEIHLPFNFAFLMLPWDAAILRDQIDRYDALVPPEGQPNYVFGNHDIARLASRLGQGQARVAAMLLLTLRGTPTLYYGDELGMENVEIPPAQYRDPQGINLGITRDFQRTPMQWDITPNAGFSAAEHTWLPVAADYLTRNVEVQSQEPTSMLSLYRRLIAVRRSTPALLSGSYRSIPVETGDCLIYLRELNNQRYLIVLNFSHRMLSLSLRELGLGRIAVSTYMDRTEGVDLSALHLREDEGLLIEVIQE